MSSFQIEARGLTPREVFGTAALQKQARCQIDEETKISTLIHVLKELAKTEKRHSRAHSPDFAQHLLRKQAASQIVQITRLAVHGHERIRQAMSPMRGELHLGREVFRLCGLCQGQEKARR